MAKYRLEVRCWLEGLIKDSGVHREKDFDNDEIAKEKLRSEVGKLFQYYDEVDWNIYCGDRKVC